MNREFKLEEIESVAKDFLDFLKKKEEAKASPSPLVVGLSGNLGAGKTTLTKEILKQLGFVGSVASPTFVLRRDYEVGNRKIIHIDAYRLENPEHLYQVINQEELVDKNNLFLVEWPEKVDQNIFDIVFQLEHVDEETRSIYVKNT